MQRTVPPGVWPMVRSATSCPRGAQDLQPPARQRLGAIVGDVQLQQHAAEAVRPISTAPSSTA